MLRSVSMDDISDGKLYTANDLVKADSLGCTGCHACCCHMGSSIVLDPLDVHHLSEALGKPAADLFDGPLALTLADKIVLPVIAMTADTDQCPFLDERGRCSVHAARPGFCRLFPLGRFYDGTGFSYFLQTGQCKKEHLAKVKVRQWLSVPNLKRYERFVCDWHYFLRDTAAASEGLSPQLVKTLHSYILKSFYLTPYDPSEDFYSQFQSRLEQARQLLLS